MSRILELVNCDQFIAFYRENRHKTVNLYATLDDPKISKVYHDGLNELKEILKDIDFDEECSTSTEFKEFLELWKRYADKYKLLLLMIYKLNNSHYINNDFDIESVKLYKKINLRYHSIVVFQIRNSYPLVDSLQVMDFKRYSEQTKLFRDKVISKSNYTLEINKSNFEVLLNSTENKRLKTNVNPSSTFNSFISESGFYFPLAERENTRLIESNLKIFDIIPNKISDFNIEKIPDQPNRDEDSSILSYLFDLLVSSRSLFLGFRSFIKISQQETVRLEPETMENWDQINLFRLAWVHIIIQVKTIRVPLEIKLDGLKFNYQSFINSKDKSDTASRKFIEVFSTAFHKALICKSNSFFISDGEFIVGVVLEPNALGEGSDSSNVHGLKSKLFSYDAKLGSFSVAIFIIMFVIIYAKAIPEPMYARLIDSMVMTKKQREFQWEMNYQLLEKFVNIISTVPTPDSMPENIQLAAIHDTEKNILQEYVSLLEFSKLFKNIVFKDFNSINISSILRGDDFQESHSVIVEDTDGSIYKIFDPIRSKVNNNNTTSFNERFSIVFDSFVREASTHMFINEDFQFKPKCLEIGYLRNDNKTFMHTISYQKEISLSGFYIKMMKLEGENLEEIWNENWAPKLREVLQNLHKLNVSHGNLQLGNFMYDRTNYSIYVVDFGRSNKTCDMQTLQESMKKDCEDLEIMITDRISEPDSRSCTLSEIEAKYS
ncbi:hypothetical protein DFJ63DRAFT_221452 [Scheffersomyces coipomensis]|uniref:uncharacterized protein n=1 Tax=Scheffersomyces coipomensis TaxID=1788519 RepID=UPI00315DB86B